MRRKTCALLDCAKNSLVLGIELFNRPHERGRQESVLLLLDHAFEMLLKAVIFEKTGRIHEPRDKQNYKFEKCLNIIQSQLGFIDSDETLVLRNLNGFRDAAVHDLVDISEGLLYGHAQSAVHIFAAILKKAFHQELCDTLPRRILPISTLPPMDITSIIAEDMAAVTAMLGKGRRREDDANAKLRPYQVIEENIRNVKNVQNKSLSKERLLKGIKKGDWKTLLPMVAGLVQPTAGGIPLSLHVTRGDGFPVRIDPNAPTAIAFRYVRPEDKYPYLTGELAEKLGISTSNVVRFAAVFKLKGNDEFHISIKTSKSGRVQRYSEKAFQVFSNAIQEIGLDQLCEKARNQETLDPAAYKSVRTAPGVSENVS